MIRHERALARIALAHSALADDAPDALDAWLALARNGVPDLPDGGDAYAVATSLPDDLAAEWWHRLGADRAVAHARLLAGRAPMALRVLREPVALPGRRVGRALFPAGNLDIHTLPDWREGRVEVQDAGSQWVVDALGIEPGMRVLDLCAGAGGKSLAMAALGARVTAWDTRSSALVQLDRRARRCGLDIRIAEPSGRFDLVLVDAPCSGTGVLRRHPENRWKLAFPTEIQRSLVERAARLAPRVAYATCSLATRENEAVVPGGLTRWPDEEGEGFYLAIGGTTPATVAGRRGYP
jgi:16S rRNA (cytosine967-C5)-methyltransferase